MQIEWLLKNANPVIRYKIHTEMQNYTNPPSISLCLNELLLNPQVKKRLSLFQSLDFSRVHGSNTSYLENILPMLNDFGINYDNEMLKNATALQYIHDAVRNYSYGEKLIAYPFLLKSGFTIEGLSDFILGRVNTIYDFTKKMNYDIYDDVRNYKSIPKNFRNRPIIKPELVNGGIYRYPLIYDVVAFAEIYHQTDHETREKIDNIMTYILSPDYEKIVFGYGVIQIPPNRYYSMGWDCKKPFMDKYINLHRLLLYSRFPTAVKSKWFQNTIDYLEQYKTAQGTYAFPKEYLVEKDSNWVLGSHISLAESRRTMQYIEIESTFYMLYLQQRKK